MTQAAAVYMPWRWVTSVLPVIPTEARRAKRRDLGGGVGLCYPGFPPPRFLHVALRALVGMTAVLLLPCRHHPVP
jgi:hypothetical protein